MLDSLTESWVDDLNKFSKDYQNYYFTKYKNRETGKLPYGKFLRLITDISLETSDFLYWFRQAIEKTNEFLKADGKIKEDTWSEALLYSPQGEFSISFPKLAIKFLFLKQYQHSFYQQNQILTS